MPADVVKNWLCNRETIEFLGLWEQLKNPDFKPVEFDGFKMAAGRNAFVLSPQKWIATTNAAGLRSKSGRHGGGTFAHVDIAIGPTPLAQLPDSLKSSLPTVEEIEERLEEK